jgi:hypothetical protein
MQPSSIFFNSKNHQTTMNSSSLDILPDEILLMIVSLTFQRDKNTLNALCLTNKTFSFLTQPFLYQKIRVNCRIANPNRPVVQLSSNSSLLYRSLSTNKTLRDHVRELSIDMFRYSQSYPEPNLGPSVVNEYVMLQQLICWLAAARKLTITETLPQKSCLPWELIVYILRNLKSLEELRFDLGASINNHALLRLIELARLKSLRVRSTRKVSIYDTEGLNYPLAPNSGSKHLLELVLEDWADTNFLKEFISTCEKLQSISGHFGIGPHQTIQDLLSPIVWTLKTLKVKFPWHGGGVKEVSLLHLQLSGLVSLTDLTICGWIFDPEDKPAEIHQALLIDSLCRITWESHKWTVILAQLIRRAFHQATCSNLENVTLHMQPAGHFEMAPAKVFPEMQLVIADLSSRGIAAQCIVPGHDK